MLIFNGLFLYPWKHCKPLVFCCFSGVVKGGINVVTNPTATKFKTPPCCSSDYVIFVGVGDPVWCCKIELFVLQSKIILILIYLADFPNFSTYRKDFANISKSILRNDGKAELTMINSYLPFVWFRETSFKFAIWSDASLSLKVLSKYFSQNYGFQ